MKNRLAINNQKHEEKTADSATKETKPAEWDITIDGARAVAIGRDNRKAQGPLPFSEARMELIHVGNTWRISSVISDEMIIEIQQGLTRSSASESATPGKPAAADPN